METEEKRQETDQQCRRRELLVRWRSNILWIILVFLAMYYAFSYLILMVWIKILYPCKPFIPDGLFYVLDYYTWMILSILLLFLLCWLIRPNRYIWKSFLLPKKHSTAELSESDRLADFYGRSRNGFNKLARGLLLGFLAVSFPIACALLHGDIKLYFDASFRQVPLFLFALFSVWAQSSAEELWCRGFLYERLHELYPLWVAVAVNGFLFGALHCLNNGITAFSVAQLVVCGVSYSLLRWYTGDMWTVMGLHTGWNFTQAFLFGLPNSGLVSEVSLFHLDAATGVSNLIYNFDFGVEAGIPAFLADLSVGVVVLILAARSGRLKELKLDRAKALSAQDI